MEQIFSLHGKDSKRSCWVVWQHASVSQWHHIFRLCFGVRKQVSKEILDTLSRNILILTLSHELLVCRESV